MSYWSTVEVHVSVICACMPAIRALMRMLWPSAFRMTEQGQSNVKHSRNGSCIMRTTQISIKAKQDEEDFVRLVDIEGGKRTKGFHNNHSSHHAMTTSERTVYDGSLGSKAFFDQGVEKKKLYEESMDNKTFYDGSLGGDA